MMMKTIEQSSGMPHPLLQSSDVHVMTSITASEIALDALDESDLLMIQTANSVYSFSLTDAKERCGLLMGGSLGEASAQALLIGAQGPEKGEAGVCRSRLMAGLPAIFIVDSTRESRRLVTSAIKSLTHLKSLLDKSQNSFEDHDRQEDHHRRHGHL